MQENRTNINQQDILKIKAIAGTLFPNSRIILFGSRARGDYSRYSDYDILIVIDKTLTPRDKIPFCALIRKELLKINVFCDVLIQSQDEINDKRLIPGHLVKSIVQEGIYL